MPFEKPYIELINLIQQEFPLKKSPFKILGEKVGLPEKEVLDFLIFLKKEKILRHLGGVPNSSKLGRTTLLCATTIPSDNQTIAYEIAGLSQVTHAYFRRHPLNFWFTLVFKNSEEAEKLISSLEKKYNIKIKKFPAFKNFKLQAVFKIKD